MDGRLWTSSLVAGPGRRHPSEAGRAAEPAYVLILAVTPGGFY